MLMAIKLYLLNHVKVTIIIQSLTYPLPGQSDISGATSSLDRGLLQSATSKLTEM
jgi:hypothetical protein